MNKNELTVYGLTNFNSKDNYSVDKVMLIMKLVQISYFFLLLSIISFISVSNFSYGSEYGDNLLQSKPNNLKNISFYKPQSPPPIISANKVLKNAWAGGLNACHFGQVDLNNDGIEEIVVFDRIGSTVMVFDNEWNYAPQYLDYLPKIESWVQFYDFNKDNLADLFTFNGVSGIRVYKNTGNGFTLYTNALQAEMFGQDIALYCTNVDFPSFADIDNDGDLDVLNFWVPSTGDFLNFYKNYAFEDLGRTDTFALRIEDYSWGCFVESEESNQIFLDSCSSNNKGLKSKFGGVKHAGSTIKAVKNYNTELYDIILGDVDYNGLFYLENGGTKDNALIVDYDSLYPSNGQSVDINNFPVVSEIKTNDSVFYLVSGFSLNQFKTAGKNTVWRYYIPTNKKLAQVAKNKVAKKPEPILMEKDFLQNTMLDFSIGSTPIVYDYNKDGLPDIIVGYYGNPINAEGEMGEYGGLALLKNIGSKTNAKFSLQTMDYLSLKAEHNILEEGFFPAIGDVNKDGKDELFIGLASGKLMLFEIMDTNSARLVDNFFDDIQLSGFASPTLFDLDGDTYLDLIIGEKQRVWRSQPRNKTKASLSYYRNILGEKAITSEKYSTIFELQTDSLGGVDVIDRTFSNFGYSRPCFYRYNSETLLFCGSENGNIYTYNNIDDNLNGVFTFTGIAEFFDEADSEITDFLEVMDAGIHASPCIYDLNNDSYPDIILGNQRGGLEIYYGMQHKVSNDKLELVQINVKGKLCEVYPNPVKDILYINSMVDEDLKFVLFDISGRRYFNNIICKSNKSFELNISALKSGVYILNVYSETNTNSFKIVKL